MRINDSIITLCGDSLLPFGFLFAVGDGDEFVDRESVVSVALWLGVHGSAFDSFEDGVSFHIDSGLVFDPLGGSCWCGGEVHLHELVACDCPVGVHVDDVSACAAFGGVVTGWGVEGLAALWAVTCEFEGFARCEQP